MLNELQARLKPWAPWNVPAKVDIIAHEQMRLRVLFVIALFKLFNFFGGNWDIQWHIAIGRDNLFIPPHLMVIVAFAGGALIAWVWTLYESNLAWSGHPLPHSVQIGPIRAAPAFLGVLLGYSGALLSGGFDEAWHRAFGIDSTLWSPPHISIMASTMVVDFSLMLGLASIAYRLGAKLEWRSPLFWGIVLTGAYTFEAVNFQMGQAFIESYRQQGLGLTGLYFPVLVGAMYPFAMMVTLLLARRFWIVLPVFILSMVLQLIGTGIGTLGFAILQPASVIKDFVMSNPDSAIAVASQFVARLGFSNLSGVQQAWAMGLSALPLGLVALLDRIRWARHAPLVAAPVYSASLVLVSWQVFKQMPVLRDYPTTVADVLLGIGVSAGLALVLGFAGSRLARIVSPSTSDRA